MTKPSEPCTRSTCREITIAMLAAQLATVPEVERAAVCVEALRMAKRPVALSPEAQLVEEQIG